MADEPNNATLDTEERARAAAARWKARTAQRRQQVAAAEKGNYTAADTADRLAKRVTRLRTMVAARSLATGTSDESLRTVMIEAPLRASGITNQLFERVIGETRDFLSIEFFERGLSAAACVGRIQTNFAINGTGFLVAPGIALTNNHVLKTIKDAAASCLELDYEANTFGERKRPQPFDLDPDSFFLTDEAHDLTLVAVKDRSQNGKALADYGHLPLIADEGKITINESVNIVQHPKGRFKQIVVRNSKLVDLPEGADADIYFHYEADTEEGSSGSPVFSDQWEVVALHHQAVPKTNAKGEMVDARNKVIPGFDDPRFDEERIVWVANEGIRTSRLVRAVRAATVDAAAHEARRIDLLALWLTESEPGGASGAVRPSESAGPVAALDTKADPPEPAPRPEHQRMEPPRSGRPVSGRPMREPTFANAPAPAALSFVVPLRIDVALGAVPANATADVLARSEAASAFQEAVRPDPDDPDYLDRPGYRLDFLDFAVPLPTLADDRHGPLLRFGSDRASELKYHHFSVLMNARRRLAYVAAVNLDAGARFRHEREPSDRWFFDPRIPARRQAGAAYYAANPLDRGHLVRRNDAAWGDSEREAKLGNDDTFHWSNCSPQHQLFNQSGLASGRGLKLWGNLENAVSDLAPTHGERLCVFNGPVFADTDRPYRDDFFLPEAYWKLIVLKGEDGQPRALAFQLSQAVQLKDLVSERFAPAELTDFEVFQVSVRELAETTGLDFGPLQAWDPLGGAPAGPARTRESATAKSAILVREEAAIRI